MTHDELHATLYEEFRSHLKDNPCIDCGGHPFKILRSCWLRAKFSLELAKRLQADRHMPIEKAIKNADKATEIYARMLTEEQFYEALGLTTASGTSDEAPLVPVASPPPLALASAPDEHPSPDASPESPPDQTPSDHPDDGPPPPEQSPDHASPKSAPEAPSPALPDSTFNPPKFVQEVTFPDEPAPEPESPAPPAPPKTEAQTSSPPPSKRRGRKKRP